MNSDELRAWIEVMEFWAKYGPLIMALTFLEFLIRLAMTWNNLSNERGADRICWLLTLQIPFFGSLAYGLIAIRERDDRITRQEMESTKPNAETLAWAKSVLDKNDGKI